MQERNRLSYILTRNSFALISQAVNLAARILNFIAPSDLYKLEEPVRYLWKQIQQTSKQKHLLLKSRFMEPV